MITFGVDIEDMLADMFSKLTITEVTNKELTKQNTTNKNKSITKLNSTNSQSQNSENNEPLLQKETKTKRKRNTSQESQDNEKVVKKIKIKKEKIQKNKAKPALEIITTNETIHDLTKMIEPKEVIIKQKRGTKRTNTEEIVVGASDKKKVKTDKRGVKRKIDTTDIVQERTKKIKHDNFTAKCKYNYCYYKLTTSSKYKL